MLGAVEQTEENRDSRLIMDILDAMNPINGLAP